MKFSNAVLLLVAGLSLATHGALAATDCSQKQRQAVNTLLDLSIYPTRVCAEKLGGSTDLTVLSTSRLCPIAECRMWLVNMTSAPDCVYDTTNFGSTYRTKAKDCPVSSTGGSGAGSSTPTTPTRSPTTSSSSSSSSSSGATGSTTKKPLPTKRASVSSSSGSGSIGTEIEVPSNDNQTVGVTEEPTDAPTTPTMTTKAPANAASIPMMKAWGVTSAVAIVAAALTL